MIDKFLYKWWVFLQFYFWKLRSAIFGYSDVLQKRKEQRIFSKNLQIFERAEYLARNLCKPLKMGSFLLAIFQGFSICESVIWNLLVWRLEVLRPVTYRGCWCMGLRTFIYCSGLHASIYFISGCGLVDDCLSDNNPPIAHLRRLASLRPPCGGRFAGQAPAPFI